MSILTEIFRFRIVRGIQSQQFGEGAAIDLTEIPTSHRCSSRAKEPFTNFSPHPRRLGEISPSVLLTAIRESG